MILQLEIPQIAKQYAWLFLAQNNMGNRGHFDGDRNRQYTGLLGEICFKKLITGYWPTLKGGYDGGFDIELDGLKADVKTMGRTVPVSPNFVHNFVLAQAHLDAEVLIFQSLIKDTSTLEVCGWISKEDALAFGTEYPKGTIRKRRDGSTFQTQAALLEVEQRFLNPFRGHLAFNLESSQLSGPIFAPAQL
jgi:hypothetical protein